ncbi:ATP:cob(I)alamin adenosyltransferase [Candidatus Peregrinibacteria bacterium CG10_big_fil_rev_8_21_14_0_10_49_10]|nr:MAG: ATP:cob(I)alamin adenosyltransferase [Candidatus Peregrinibacteria bacterium CG10_big_fil_rev_8_21_14_0_10_49_10]
MGRPSLSTKTGDKGTTGLFGGKRVSKESDRIHAVGTVDELNAVLGVVLANHTLPEAVASILSSIQNTLFCIGSDLATPPESAAQIDRLEPSVIQQLEKQGVALEEQLSSLTVFILPGGSSAGALLHQARTVCRRAERCVVALAEFEEVNESVRVYLNRLSDYLFLAARFVNKHVGIEEVEWRGQQV